MATSTRTTDVQSPYGPDQRLSRSAMQAILASGGTVSHKGHLIERPEQIPSAVDLAENDPAQLELAGTDLEARIAAMAAQLADIRGRLTTTAPVPDADLQLAEGRPGSRAGTK